MAVCWTKEIYTSHAHSKLFAHIATRLVSTKEAFSDDLFQRMKKGGAGESQRLIFAWRTRNLNLLLPFPFFFLEDEETQDRLEPHLVVQLRRADH